MQILRVRFKIWWMMVVVSATLAATVGAVALARQAPPTILAREG